MTTQPEKKQPEVDGPADHPYICWDPKRFPKIHFKVVTAVGPETAAKLYARNTAAWEENMLVAVATLDGFHSYVFSVEMKTLVSRIVPPSWDEGEGSAT